MTVAMGDAGSIITRRDRISKWSLRPDARKGRYRAVVLAARSANCARVMRLSAAMRSCIAARIARISGRRYGFVNTA